MLELEGFEDRAGPWRNTQLVSKPIHTGKRALRWDVAAHPILDSPRFIADWRSFDEFRFWAYLQEPVEFKIPLVFPSEGGYYIIDWQLDWQGWKEHRIKLNECPKAHRPAGWHDIRSFGFRPQGYGQGPVPAGLTLVFDDFALHSPRDLPETSLDAWLAKERQQRIKQLKARGNPYYCAILDGLKDVKPEPGLPAQLKSPWEFAGIASRAMTMAWAASWDNSSRKGDADLIAHAAALVDFCLGQQKDGSWFYSRKWGTGDPNSDRFALGPLMDAVWWLRRLPGTEPNWKRWETPLRELVEFQYTHWGRYKEMGFTNNVAWGSSAGVYPNQDVFHLYEMAVAHEFWGEKKYLDEARETLGALEAHLRPDGGLNYIGPETEIPCYHDLNVVWIARYYRLTGDERARNLLANTVNYYPLAYSNEGRPEYYTDCWWKHYWSDGAACGPEIIAGITGDPHSKWLADRLLERRGTGSAYHAIYAGMFYRDDIEPRALPDNWLKLDRNIGGPRGRYGSWYFAGVPGGGARDTFVGAMICEPDCPEPLNGAFLAANIEVELGGETKREGPLYISGHDDVTSVVIDGDAAALGTRYSPRKPYINGVHGRKVAPTPWQATQVWLLARHGLVGLVELAATEEQTVSCIRGQLRFGPHQSLTRDESGIFRCGAMTMRLLEHGFAAVDSGPARPGYARKSTPHSAVVLRTPADSYTAKPGEALGYAAVIAPDGASVTDFKRVGSPSLWAFEVSLDGKMFVVAFNPGETPLDIEIPWHPAVRKGTLGPAAIRKTVTVRPRSVVLLRRPGSPKSSRAD